MEPVQNEKGEWVIPASRRPDGTWRKEKVMKEGYVPPDEVKAFETRASKNAKKGIPGLPPPPVAAPKAIAPKPSAPKATPAPKKDDTKTTSVKADQVSVPDIAQLKLSDSTDAKVEQDASKDPAKRLKALKKKLREITDIESKPANTLTPEQIEKLGRKASIISEIESLAEFDK